MFYFKFTIPNNADGSTVSYSPGWCGTRPHCAKNEVGLMYNDKERWGIGRAEGEFVPPDVEVLDEKTALSLIDAADDADEKVFKGQKLADRYLPEAEHEEVEDTPESLKAESETAKKVVVDTYLKVCPVCHKNVAWVVRYEDNTVKIVQDGKTLIDGINAKTLVVTCTDGHRVKVVINGG